MKNSERSEARKNRILDIAEALFVEKGYEHTTINDVLNASGIAKGSLYYYFKSKEDVLDGIIERRSDEHLRVALDIAKDDRLNAQEKLLRIILSLQPKDESQKKLTTDLEQSSNGQMFIKSLKHIVLRLAPVLGGVAEQGIAEGVFSTPYPLESSEILLAAAHALFDNGDFSWTQEEEMQKVTAFVLAVERTIGAAEGSLLGLVWSAVTEGDYSHV